MYGPVAYTDGACLGNPGPGGWGVRLGELEFVILNLTLGANIRTI